MVEFEREVKRRHATPRLKRAVSTGFTIIPDKAPSEMRTKDTNKDLKRVRSRKIKRKRPNNYLAEEDEKILDEIQFDCDDDSKNAIDLVESSMRNTEDGNEERKPINSEI
jgi:hypothetical protein